MIVLSSDLAVKDLMDKRSNIYSDRPDMYMMKIISGGNRFLNMVKSLFDHSHDVFFCLYLIISSRTARHGDCSASYAIHL